MTSNASQPYSFLSGYRDRRTTSPGTTGVELGPFGQNRSSIQDLEEAWRQEVVANSYSQLCFEMAKSGLEDYKKKLQSCPVSTQSAMIPLTDALIENLPTATSPEVCYTVEPPPLTEGQKAYEAWKNEGTKQSMLCRPEVRSIIREGKSGMSDLYAAGSWFVLPTNPVEKKDYDPFLYASSGLNQLFEQGRDLLDSNVTAWEIEEWASMTPQDKQDRFFQHMKGIERLVDLGETERTIASVLAMKGYLSVKGTEGTQDLQ